MHVHLAVSAEARAAIGSASAGRSGGALRIGRQCEGGGIPNGLLRDGEALRHGLAIGEQAEGVRPG